MNLPIVIIGSAIAVFGALTGTKRESKHTDNGAGGSSDERVVPTGDTTEGDEGSGETFKPATDNANEDVLKP